jgi:hypothetical protein
MKNVITAIVVLIVLAVVYVVFIKNPSTAVQTPSTSGVGAKIDINAVCEGALAYMTFPDAANAEVFVAECKEGKRPEVIEKYKDDMNLGDGAAI